MDRWTKTDKFRPCRKATLDDSRICNKATNLISSLEARNEQVGNLVVEAALLRHLPIKCPVTTEELNSFPTLVHQSSDCRLSSSLL